MKAKLVSVATRKKDMMTYVLGLDDIDVHEHDFEGKPADVDELSSVGIVSQNTKTYKDLREHSISSQG